MKLCLISSNIRFDNPADGVNAWPHRRFLLKQTLLDHGPDIIATQEGRFNQLKDFEELLDTFHIVDQHRSWIRERMYPTFFVRKNKFELIQSQDIWLSQTPHIPGSKSFNSAFPRLMTWMKIQPKNSDLNFLVINTHLDHLRKETRIGQIKILCQEIAKIWEKNTKLIIMGDFNDSPDSEVRASLVSEFPHLQDSWKIHNDNEESSHHGFQGHHPDGSRIDWILVDHSLKVDHCQLDKKNIKGRYPSDHFPVVCKISL